MFFRPVEPRGDVFDAMRHWLALAFLLLIGLATIGTQLVLSAASIPGGMGFLDYAIGYVQLLFLPLAGLNARYWVPLVGAIVLALLLHFVFYMSVMTILGRMRALSLANVLVGTTLLSAALALLPVLTGYGSVAPRYRLPLLEDYAQSFLVYAIAFGLGGVLEWICLRTAPQATAP